MATFNQALETITVESVVPLSAQQTQALLTQLKLEPSQVRFKNRHSPLLIAGIRVHFRGKLIDLSFRHQLNQLGQS